MTARKTRERPIRIGVSSCLLGHEVRYDGGHKHDRFLTDVLGPYVEWVAVCPEIEIGLGAPRESMHLVERDGAVRLVTAKSGRDYTRAMRDYARSRVAALEAEDLSGYVLKKGSPSCGMERVKTHRAGASPRAGRGLFAEALLERFPNLPIVEEDRLADPRIRESWIERVFAYRRFRSLREGRSTIRKLAAFHAAHELALLAHSPKAWRDLDRLVERAKTAARRGLRERYEKAFLAALGVPATRRRHARALRRAARTLGPLLDQASRRELERTIDDYRRGLSTLVAPIRLLRRHARRFEVAELLGQVYLEPHPVELALRNRP